MNPLLSICIPTYNRAKFLKVMLEALLPQVSEASNEVEVWVLDNASSDNTKTVVELSRKFGPVNYHCNERNLGPLINVIKGPTTIAAGEYVWVLGDHNLLRPGALKRVLEVLKVNSILDVFYANYRCATYPEHWPKRTHRGYDGSYHYLGNADIYDRDISKWHELIRPANAFCTQVYVHLVRRHIWLDYWDGRSIGRPFTCARTTYPHTSMLAETCWDASSFYIGDPVLTSFDGAQSWGDPESRTRVYLRGFPDLIQVFERQKWPREQVSAARAWGGHQLGKALDVKFSSSSEHPKKLFFETLLSAVHYKYLVTEVCKSFARSEYCFICRIATRVLEKMRKFYFYLFRDCRPARWFRRYTS